MNVTLQNITPWLVEILRASSFGPLGLQDDGFPGKCLDFRLGFGHADDYGASAWEFFVGDFGDELQVQTETPAFLICHVVKKVNDVAAKSIFGAAAFVEIEWAGRIHFQFGYISQDSTELALEVERSLAHFRHSKSDNMEGHKSRPSIADEYPICPAGLQLTSGVSYV